MRPSRAGWRRLGVAALVLVAGLLLALFWPPWPPVLPPLLRGATAGGGWLGACPATPDEARERARSPLAISPELDARLRQRFPPGSDEDRLVAELRHEGFGEPSVCQDASVRFARFQQRGGGMLWFPMWAAAYWKVDDAGRIVWTRGFVAFTGP